VAAKEATAAVLERNATMTVLVVDDEESARTLCCEVAAESGMRAKGVATTEQALEVLDQHPIDMVITDIRVPQLGGFELLKRVRALHPQTGVMMLTQYGTIDNAVEATRLGAADYITKPFRIDDLRGKIARLARSLELDHENRVLREQLRTRRGFGDLVGFSPKMEKVYRLIEKLADQSSPVLVLGESGTGKELVASSIHHAGPRKNKPFVPVDCSALAPTLIESELFGHVRGAFTGAVQNKPGLLEVAGDGTIFLDEIGDLPLDLQAKLLRALQSHEIRPLGSNERVKLTARVIAATNRDLAKEVEKGTFRRDLFYRLNVVNLRLAPLRDRKEDIPALVAHFLSRYGRNHSLTQETLEAMISYDWPGNVRELENCIQHMVAINSGPLIHTVDLPSMLQNHLVARRSQSMAVAVSAGPGPSVAPMPRPLEPCAIPVACPPIIPLMEMEKQAIIGALEFTKGDRAVAANLLGIGRTTLYRKLKEYQIAS